MFQRTPPSATPDFAVQSQSARRVLAIDIGGLGDVVHALPALWSVRQTYPQAELGVLVRSPFAALLKLAPWIDRVWGYDARRKGERSNDWTLARAIRREGYQVSINLMGSNRSCTIAWLSGARQRLGRKPAPHQEHLAGWRWLNTQLMQQPYFTTPRYLQKWRCLHQAGICSEQPAFPIEPQRAALPAGFDAEGQPYLHVSLFTSATQKEPPPNDKIALLQRLRAAFPGHRLVLSCADDARERAELADVVAGLDFKPWRIYAGELDAAELFAVIRDAALNLSGDTGTMHIGWLAGTPSVHWFWDSGALAEWAPADSGRHALIVLREKPVDYLRGIDLDAVVDAARLRIRGPA